MANVKHLASPAGLLQIVHLVFGIIAIGCGAASYESHFFRERFFFWSVVALLIISVVMLVLSVITGNMAVKAVSSGTHALGGVILIAAGTLMILSVQHIDKNLCSPNPWNADCNFDKPVKLAAAVKMQNISLIILPIVNMKSFAIINGILYLLASALIVMVKNQEDEPGTYLEHEKRQFGRPKQ